jgi:hypothetical protein
MATMWDFFLTHLSFQLPRLKNQLQVVEQSVDVIGRAERLAHNHQLRQLNVRMGHQMVQLLLWCCHLLGPPNIISLRI